MLQVISFTQVIFAVLSVSISSWLRPVPSQHSRMRTTWKLWSSLYRLLCVSQSSQKILLICQNWSKVSFSAF